MTSATDPLASVTSYQYDARNRFSRVEHPLGSLVLTYDAAGAITDLSYSDGTRSAFAYDGAGRLVTATGVALGYDDHDRVISSNGISVTRDAGNRITSLVLEPGKTITYTYDNRNLLTSVADWAGATTAFSYDDGGRMVSTTRPNGVVTTYTYDAASRLTGMAENRGATALSSIALGRNGANRITQATRTLPLGPSAQTGTRNATFNDADQIVGSTYDSRGRLTAGGGRTYAWDLTSRLTSYTEGQNSALFTYDAFGNRLTRDVGSATRGFVWNYALGLPSVSTVRDNNTTTRYYVHTPAGALLYSIEAAGNARRYYHFDEVGSTIFLTGDAGAITDRYSYSPYGEVLESSGGTDNPFQFVGRYGVEREPSTGLYYMRARYYDSLTGRFVSRDPLGAQIARPGRLNLYQYASQDPVGRIDPLGLQDAKKLKEIYSDFRVNGPSGGEDFDEFFGITHPDRPIMPPGAEVLSVQQLFLNAVDQHHDHFVLVEPSSRHRSSSGRIARQYGIRDGCRHGRRHRNDHDHRHAAGVAWQQIGDLCGDR